MEKVTSLEEDVKKADRELLRSKTLRDLDDLSYEMEREAIMELEAITLELRKSHLSFGDGGSIELVKKWQRAYDKRELLRVVIFSISRDDKTNEYYVNDSCLPE